MSLCDMELLPVASEGMRRRRHGDGCGGYSHREGFIWIGVPSEDVGRVFVHEWFHFFEHASTPLGLFRSELHHIQLTRTVAFLSGFSDPIYVPVCEWARAFRNANNTHSTVSDPSAFDRLIANHIGPWTRCAWLEEAIDGVDSLESKVGSEAKAAAVLDSVEQMTTPWGGLNATVSNRPFQPLLSSDAQEEIRLSPLIELRTDHRSVHVPLAGLHLSEAMAQILEGVRTGEIASLPVEYSVLLKLTFRCWQELGRSIDSSTQRVVAYTCLALADLSCFVPIGTVYGALRPAMQRWQDIHPGHRFLQALDAAIGADAWISTLDDAERLADRIADELGWARPRRFLELGVSLPPINSDAAAHRDACQVRLGRFSAFMDTGRWRESDIVEFIDVHMPMSHTIEGGFVCPVPEDDPSVAVVRLRNYSIARLCSLVMTGRHAICLSDLLPANFPYSRHFDPLYASRESFFGLLLQTHPWASLARIRTLGQMC